MRLNRLLLAACCVVALAGCYHEPVALRTSPPQSNPVTDLRPSITPQTAPTASPGATLGATPGQPSVTPIDLTPDTPPPTSTPTGLPSARPSPTPGSTSPLASGSPSAGCIDGWSALAAGSPLYQEALDLLDAQMAVEGPWTVPEMRYFTGPDVPWILEPHYDVVEYWYVRAALVDDPGFAGRWLLEKRTDAIKGVAAVAPFGSFDYESPDWTAFEGDGEPTTYLGLPGQWAGIPYDFVTGEGDGGQPGLPDEVVDCLAAS